MSVLASAPGKVILFGEHGVVYGKPAIAVSIDIRTYGLFEPGGAVARLRLPDIGVDLQWDAAALSHPGALEPVPDALKATLEGLVPADCREANRLHATLAFLYLYSRLHCGGLTVTIRSALPVGAGLGSSASYSVVLAAGLLALRGERDPDIVNSWAFMAEKIIHGNPSGLDNALCTYGGAKIYTRGNAPIDLQQFRSPILLLTNTLVPKNTMRQVANVRILRDRLPAAIDPIIDAVGAISPACAKLYMGPPEAIQDGLQSLVDANHGLLVALGTSHPALEKVREVTARYGMASKLTGGGGGGCALTLVRDDLPEETIQKAEAELRSCGFECFRTPVGGPGFSAKTVTGLTAEHVVSLDFAAINAAVAAGQSV